MLLISKMLFIILANGLLYSQQGLSLTKDFFHLLELGLGLLCTQEGNEEDTIYFCVYLMWSLDQSLKLTFKR